MASSYVQSWEETATGSGTTDTVVVSGATSGNLLVGVVTLRWQSGAAIAFSTPSGWTEVGKVEESTFGCAMYCRVASATAGDNLASSWVATCYRHLSVSEYSGLQAAFEDFHALYTATTSLDLAATPTTQPGRAIASFSARRNDNWCSDQAGTGLSVSDSYVIDDYATSASPTATGLPATAVSSIAYAATSEQSPSWSTTQAGGAAGGVLAVFPESVAGTPPTVDSGGPYSGVKGNAISLDATVTPGTDGAPTYAWSIVSGGTGTFSSSTAIDPTFTPDAVATYTLRLTVSTSDASDVTDDCTLTSNEAGAWVLTNATASFDAVGLGGTDGTATTFAATAVDGSVIGSAVTMASGTHTGRFFLKRSAGNGAIQITIDGGTTWETIAAPGSAAFTEYVKEQSSLANPSIGIRLKASGDIVIVGNAELYLNTSSSDVDGVDHLWTYGTEETAYRVSATELTGTWSASTGWTVMNDNSRLYSVDEGTGTTLLARDGNGDLVPANNATVQNSGSGGGGWT